MDLVGELDVWRPVGALEKFAEKQRGRTDTLAEYIDVLGAVPPVDIDGQCLDCENRLEVNERPMTESTVECSHCDRVAARVK